MQPIYLYLILFTPFFPILLSFDKRVNFVSRWKYAILSAILIAIPYLIWDEIFTENGYWGFNPDYLTGIYLGELPIEEVSFFFVVPFACTFIHECVKYYFRNSDLNVFNHIFWLAITIYAVVVGTAGLGGWYTSTAIGLGLVLIVFLFLKRKQYTFIPLAFSFSMIPFLLVNGILTGSFLDNPIVWYNETQFSTWRMFTIPFEDVIYGFGLIVLNIMLVEYMINRAKQKSSASNPY